MEKSLIDYNPKEWLLELLKDKQKKTITVDKFSFSEIEHTLDLLATEEHVFVNKGIIEKEDIDISSPQEMINFITKYEDMKYHFGVIIYIEYKVMRGKKVYKLKLQEMKLRTDSWWYFWTKSIIETKILECNLMFLSENQSNEQ